MMQVGCLISALGVSTLAVSLFGLRHTLIEFSRILPVLPGLASAVTYLARALIRQAAANVDTGSAVVLIALGLFLLYRGGHETP
jgi:hypothetical protein